VAQCRPTQPDVGKDVDVESGFQLFVGKLFEGLFTILVRRIGYENVELAELADRRVYELVAESSFL
jgi:hypothetical protein